MKITSLLKKLIKQEKITDPETPRGRILSCSARLFRKKGYNNTTVRDIAAEVGILSGSIFHHYKNKDEILFNVMNEAVIAIDEGLTTALKEANSSEEKVRTLIKTELMLIHGQIRDASAVLIFEWRALSKDKQAQVLAGRKHYFQLWNDVLLQAKNEGLTDIEPEYLRQLLHGAMVWTQHWFSINGKLTLEELVERTLSLAIQNKANKDQQN